MPHRTKITRSLNSWVWHVMGLTFQGKRSGNTLIQPSHHDHTPRTRSFFDVTLQPSKNVVNLGFVYKTPSSCFTHASPYPFSYTPEQIGYLLLLKLLPSRWPLRTPSLCVLSKRCSQLSSSASQPMVLSPSPKFSSQSLLTILPH